VCPGAARTRERRAQREREAAQRQQLQAEILRDFDLGRGKAADEIQRELLAAYRAHGVEPPSDFGRVTRFMSAGSARRGTRTLRLVWELGSGLRALERWAGEHANDDEVGARIDASASAENRGQRRRLHAAVTGCVALAVAAAGAGWKTTGTVRVLFAVAAAVIAALSACVGLLDFVIGLLDRLVGVGSPRPPDGNGSS
jgi:hypothetical protein